MVFYCNKKGIEISTQSNIEKEYIRSIKNSKLSETNKLKLIYILQGIEDDFDQKDVESIDKEFFQNGPSFEQILYLKKLKKELFEFLSSTLFDGIVLLENNGNIVFSNESALEIFGSQKYLCIDDVFGNFFNQELDLEKFEEDSLGKDKELSFYDKKGNLKFIKFSFYPIEKINQKKMYVGVFKDITNEKYIESIKDNAVKTIKHDLKGSIGNIKYISELLLSEDLNNITDDQKEYIELIQYVSENLLYQLKDFLNIARIYRGDYEINKEVFNLFDVFMNLKKEFETSRLKENKKIKFKNLNREVYDCIQNFVGEKGLIISIFVNIIKNALEYTPKGENISIFVEKRDDLLQFKIRNPLPVDDKIKSCFFQPYISGKERGGTGLGTYSAKVLIEAHGGNVDLISSEKEGTYVKINLPYK